MFPTMDPRMSGISMMPANCLMPLENENELVICDWQP